MSSQKNLLLIRRLWLLKGGNKSDAAARRQLTAASTMRRHKSSVSPALQQADDHEDDAKVDGHKAMSGVQMRRPTATTHLPPPPRTIQVQSPPILEEAAAASASVSAAAIVEQDNVQSVESPSELKYTGDATFPITTRLHIVKPGEDTPKGIWPVFRLMVREIEIAQRVSLCLSVNIDGRACLFCFL